MRLLHSLFAISHRRFVATVTQRRGLSNKKLDDSYKNEDNEGTSSLLENATSDYLQAEPAELDDPWSSPPYPASIAAALQREQSRLSFRPAVDPRDTSIILFPGQGAQYVGMAKELLDYPNVSEMFATASSILGYNLLKLCLEGPEEQLNRTLYCQPAVFVTSLASVEKLKSRYHGVAENCIATAGFSVGEIAALVFAGALSFEDALRFIKIRAEAMQAASERTPSGMLTVFMSERSMLQQVMSDAIEHMRKKGIEQPVCSIANYLFTQCKVIAGHDEGLKFIEENAKAYKLRCKRIPVSGAFHTSLMQPACERLVEAAKTLKIDRPLIPVHSNVNGRPLWKPVVIRQNLVKQVVSAVRWEQILHIIYTRDAHQAFPKTFEMAPGRQLGAMLKNTNYKAMNTYLSIET